jgi:hypothetical protein
MSGSHDGIELDAGTPQSAFAPHPCCQMSAITPHDATRLRTLRTRALRGRKTEPSARARSRKVSTAITTSISRKLS